MDLGFIQAGFNIVWANDINKYACQTYRAMIGPHIHEGDISQLDLDELPDCELVVGGPPCQPFSRGGKLDPNDDRIENLWTFVRVVEAKQPEYFVMENVEHLANAARFSDVRERLFGMFEAAGYDICAQVLDASKYDVAQERERFFIIGTRRGIEVCDLVPVPRTYRITIRDRIQDLPPFEERTDDSITGSELYIIKNPQLRSHPYRGNLLFNGRGKVCDLDQPAKTVLASGGQLTHAIEENLLYDPHDDSWLVALWESMWAGKRYPPKTTPPPYVRRLSIREQARLQGFPDRFVFEGPHSAQIKQIGNAVPPPLAKHIARMIMGMMLGKPVYEPIPTGIASRAVAGKLAIGEIVTEVYPDDDDLSTKRVWIDGEYRGLVWSEGGKWYAVRPHDQNLVERDSEYEAIRALPVLQLETELGGVLQPFMENPQLSPPEVLRGFGFHGDGPDWVIADDQGYEVRIEASDGRSFGYDDSVLVTIIEGGEFIEDFETSLQAAVVGLERWRDDDAGMYEIMQYVAVADRVWARNPEEVSLEELAEWLASPENFMVERGYDPDIIWLYAEEPVVAIQNLIGDVSDFGGDQAAYDDEYGKWQADFDRGLRLAQRMERAEEEHRG
jgi:DNA (cytosine-5)-methyltransferase 1